MAGELAPIKGSGRGMMMHPAISDTKSTQTQSNPRLLI